MVIQYAAKGVSCIHEIRIKLCTYKVERKKKEKEEQT